MEILWICGSRIVGGAERATWQIVTLLRDRGHAVTVACPADSRLLALTAAEGVRSEALPSGRWLTLAPRTMARLLASATPDVALVTTANEWVAACLWRRARPATRLVLLRHMALPLSWRVRWLAARRADAVVAVSQVVRASLLGTVGLRPAQIHVIANPVRFAPRPAVPDAAERRRARVGLGLPDDGRWVGFFGGHDPNKGLADVARAVREANRTLGPTNLLLCGRGGNGGGRARELARGLDLDGRVHDLGEIESVAEALTAVDLVVMATHRRLSEALPATLIEAMACGTAVLAYATGGMREVIGMDGEAGRLAKPDDADDLAAVLIDVLRDPAAAERMATAALARARQLFDPALAAERYERLFEMVMANTRADRFSA